jgi:hypothetical protein
MKAASCWLFSGVCLALRSVGSNSDGGDRETKSAGVAPMGGRSSSFRRTRKRGPTKHGSGRGPGP